MVSHFLFRDVKMAKKITSFFMQRNLDHFAFWPQFNKMTYFVLEISKRWEDFVYDFDWVNQLNRVT